ncbi:hypothetical protein LCGC14_0424880 [marine sediment metagenome]|uniref:VRR-NUC domain-containing protein n=1 Tax=marine sediment metagenome TaxID=412755 RepID=A0A0F9VBY1_9ZZZZ
MTQESEHIAQCKVVQYLRSRGIGVFSVPNGFMVGGKNKWALITKFKAEGMLSGAPDLIVMRQTFVDQEFRPVAIEMKREGLSQVLPEQKEIHERMRREGWHVIVAYGSQDAIRQIDELSF